MKNPLAVIAIGGNSLILDSKKITVRDQYRAASETSHHIAALVAAGYRVVVWDQRGHGRSGKGATAGYHIDQLGKDLYAVLEAVAPTGDLALGGHSMGGMTAMRFAGQHPDVLAQRVAGLVFLATRAHQVMPPYVDGAARVLVGRGQAIIEAGGTLPQRASMTTSLARAMRSTICQLSGARRSSATLSLPAL